MEYRSPLGYNFKLEQSLSASREGDSELPRRDDFMGGDKKRRSKFFEPDSRRNSGFRNSCSPAQMKHSGHWKSPRNYPEEQPTPVEQFYHPSMLENPWEELERNLNASKKN